MGTKRRALRPREVHELRRQVEKRERVRFPHLRVLFPRSMKHKDDYANWRGTPKQITIRVFRGEPVDLQRLALEHELTEIAHVLKGRSVGASHRRALGREKHTLKSMPYRTHEGRPYKRALPLMRRMQSGGWRPRPSQGMWTWLSRLLGGWWP